MIRDDKRGAETTSASLSESAEEEESSTEEHPRAKAKAEAKAKAKGKAKAKSKTKARTDSSDEIADVESLQTEEDKPEPPKPKAAAKPKAIPQPKPAKVRRDAKTLAERKDSKEGSSEGVAVGTQSRSKLIEEQEQNQRLLVVSNHQLIGKKALIVLKVLPVLLNQKRSQQERKLQFQKQKNQSGRINGVLNSEPNLLNK